jgi:hypothetical protein
LYANEISLRERVKDILEICPPVTAGLIGNGPAAKRFVNDGVTTRNYLTHYTKELEKRTSTGVKLTRIGYQLEGLIESVLLTELGFECERIAEMLERMRRFERIQVLKKQE